MKYLSQFQDIHQKCLNPGDDVARKADRFTRITAIKDWIKTIATDAQESDCKPCSTATTTPTTPAPNNTAKLFRDKGIVPDVLTKPPEYTLSV